MDPITDQRYHPEAETRPQEYNIFSCSTQLGIKFQLLLNGMADKKIQIAIALKLSDVFILLINLC